jgi:AcrR family transcriptional regulator
MPRIFTEYREEVGKKIVEAAYCQFLTKGYHGTTMSDIAKSLGVTKTALYQYFSGKEDLYAAVAEHSSEELAAILEKSFNKRDIRSGSEVLFDKLLHYAPQFNSMYSEMALLALHNERIRTLLQQDMTVHIQVVEKFISQQQKSGLIPDQLDPHVLAITCNALINGLFMNIMAGMDKEEAKSIWISTVTLLLRTD